MSKPIVTAGDLRSYFNADPKRLDALSPAARKTVEQVEGKSPRGQVHPEAIKLHNQRRKVAYTRGASAPVVAAAKAAKAAQRDALREAGISVGERGPLPKAVLETLKG